MSAIRSAVVVVVALATGACVELSPLDYAAPEAGISDAAPLDAPTGDGRAVACDTCFAAQPTCSTQWSACEADKICSKFAACMSQMSCWNSSITDLMNLSPCIVTCSLSAGITSQNSPAAALISPLFTCAQDPLRCGPVCADIIGDAGVHDAPAGDP
jgi:hypothetical protein